VMLRVVAGLDVAAVAELVGKKPGAVRVAVHRALKSLARARARHDSSAPASGGAKSSSEGSEGSSAGREVV
jgi:RNA polymerase sigma-70 factor, ECF subfamily